MLHKNPGFLRHALTALALILGPSLAAGQATDSIQEGSNLNLSEIVVTGQYGYNTATKAVQKITVIDRRQIDAMAAQNLRDILANQTGIRLSQDDILGSSMSLQGISGQNVKYLMDGVPIVGRQNGDIDLSQINLANIQSIEIVSGPMSVNYGNNALGGTINLITKKKLAKTAEANINTYLESIGTYNLTARSAIQKNNHQFALNAGRNYFDGWILDEKISFNQGEQPADNSRFQQWKPKLQYFGDVQYSYVFGKNLLRYKGSFITEEIRNLGMPKSPYGEAALDDTYRTRRIDHAVFWTNSFSKLYKMQFQTAYNNFDRVKNTYVRDLTTLGSTLSQNGGDQDTAQFKLLHSRGTISRLAGQGPISYELGYDINSESASGERIEGGQQSIGDYAIFTSAEYIPVNGLVIRPGIRWAHNTRYAAPLSPALNLRYGMGSHWTLRASYAKGFRAPDLKELYFYFVDVNHNIGGNPNLRPERSNNFNVHVDYASRIEKFVYTLEASAFYNDIQNLISLASITPTEYSYINVGRYRTHGLGLNASGSLGFFSGTISANLTGYFNQLSEEVLGIESFSYALELRGSASYRLAKVVFLLMFFTNTLANCQAMQR